MSNKRAEGLDEMANSFLMCRDKGHHWGHLNDKVTAGSGRRIREVSRWYQCKTCTTEMQEVFDIPSCDIKSRRYVYPDGYLLAQGRIDGRPLRVRDVRREVFSRSGIKF